MFPFSFMSDFLKFPFLFLLWPVSCSEVCSFLLICDFLSFLSVTYFSVQFSSSVMSDSLQPHGLQHTRRPCPSPTPRAYWKSCPSSQWCHPTISSSVPFSSSLHSFPASGSFLISQFYIRWPKYWNSNFSISPSSEYSGLISFRIDWLDFLAIQRTLKSLLHHHSSKASVLWHLVFFMV